MRIHWWLELLVVNGRSKFSSRNTCLKSESYTYRTRVDSSGKWYISLYNPYEQWEIEVPSHHFIIWKAQFSAAPVSPKPELFYRIHSFLLDFRSLSQDQSVVQIQNSISWNYFKINAKYAHNLVASYFSTWFYKATKIILEKIWVANFKKERYIKKMVNTLGLAFLCCALETLSERLQVPKLVPISSY